MGFMVLASTFSHRATAMTQGESTEIPPPAWPHVWSGAWRGTGCPPPTSLGVEGKKWGKTQPGRGTKLVPPEPLGLSW